VAWARPSHRGLLESFITFAAVTPTRPVSTTSHQMTRSLVAECRMKGCRGPLFTFPAQTWLSHMEVFLTVRLSLESSRCKQGVLMRTDPLPPRREENVKPKIEHSGMDQAFSLVWGLDPSSVRSPEPLGHRL
jgi:hypothetical protein